MTVQELVESYKSELLKNHSKITVKNYLSDINHFLGWFDNNFKSEFSPDLLTKTVTIDYENSLGLPRQGQSAALSLGAQSANWRTSTAGYSLGLPRQGQSAALSYKSLKRHLSSLRSFTNYLYSSALITSNPFHEGVKPPVSDDWKIGLFKNYLLENKASNLTIKYYINDLKFFIRSVETSGINFNDFRLNNITASTFLDYASKLKSESGLSPRSVNRKLSSLRRYLSFISSQDFSQDFEAVKNIPLKASKPIEIENLTINAEKPSYSGLAPIRFFQRFSNLYSGFEQKTADLISDSLASSRFKKLSRKPSSHRVFDEIAGQLRSHRIKKEFYAPYSISIASFPLYRKLIYHTKHTRPEWYKRYHNYTFVHYLHLGVLVIFAVGISLFLYNHTLGQAGASGVSKTQAKTFIFKGKLLDKSGNPVNSTTDIRLALYNSPTGSEQTPLWKEDQNSIKPDQYGNVVLAVGSRKEIPAELFDQNQPLFLGIGIEDEEELTPRQQIGVPYALSAQNVQGFVPISNTSKQTNVLLALDAGGALTIGGSANPVFKATGGDFTISGQTMILTTNASTDGNIILNPDGNGKIDIFKPIISSSGTVNIQGIFSVEATGSAQSTLSVSQYGAGALFTGSSFGKTKFNIDNQGVITKGEWAGSPIGTAFGGFGASITAAFPGELLYSTTNTTYGHLPPGIAGDCLISDGRKAPLWSSCGYLAQINGHLTLTNNTLDIILGSISTSSAKFAFRNLSSGTPTFTVGSSLNISSDNLIETINSDLKIGGPSTKNVLLASAGGNAGIGTSSPSRTLDIKGNFGGNVDYYSDGSGNNVITRNTKALVYDLEKSTGSSDTSSTTTYNITGLPDVDGTIAYIYTKTSKGSTLAAQTQTLVLQINGIQISSISTANVTTTDTTIKHYTAVRSNSAWHLLGSYGDSDTADLAEWIETNNEFIESGSLVSIEIEGKVTKSNMAHDSRLAGIVSTNPNIIIGPQTENSVRLALSGRVPAIVSSLSGDISEGDAITSSPLPGIGMKPEVNSAIVGKALQEFRLNGINCIETESINHISWPEDDGTNKLKPCFKIKVENIPENLQDGIITGYGYTKVDYIYIGKIMVLSNISWSNTDDFIASLDSTRISPEDSPNLHALDPDFSNIIDEINEVNPAIKVGSRTVKKIAVFGGIVAGKIKAGSIIGTNIASRNLISAKGFIEDLTSQNITAKKSVTSPLARLDELKTDTISPFKNNTVTIEIPQSSDSALIVRNSATRQDVARVDSEGNASFSGSLSSNNLDTNEASISGTLHANNLIANNILGLDEKVSSLAAQIISSKDSSGNIPISGLSEYFSKNSISAKFGIFHDGLLSLGASTFGNLSVMENLSIGTSFIFSNNSINTLGSDLSIQPLKQGAVSFLAGALRIETDGRLIVQEDAEFKKNLAVKGKLYSNVISPLAEEDLIIELGSSSTHDSEFVIHDSSSSAVFSVNNKGDVKASGSASFAKINFNLVEQAFAVNPNTAVASTSAGTAILKVNSNELTVLNPLVTSNSLIYITPAKDTNNNVLFLMRQNAEDEETEGTEGSFTVGTSTAVNQDILFNWLIVN